MADTQPPTATVEQQIQPQDELPTRWEIELEFVQSLANTQYLSYLAQQGYFKDECFVNYLRYLTYWKDPKYSKFIVYPNCLHILSMLQNERFRMDVQNQNFTNLLYNDMVEYWREPLFKAEKESEKSVDDNTTKEDTKLSTQEIAAGDGDVVMNGDVSASIVNGDMDVNPLLQPPVVPNSIRLTSASPGSDISSASPR